MHVVRKQYLIKYNEVFRLQTQRHTLHSVTENRTSQYMRGAFPATFVLRMTIRFMDISLIFVHFPLEWTNSLQIFDMIEFGYKFATNI